ncbi:peptidase [Kitasatospora sp. MMS16-BH015]|uniref:peptidase n=1 Tax=Kitasatospora sp. MMS16-BH015 TaxID=2018025 RepID=UPI0020C2AC4B|nr:peptidase [Kitasatospora sp. MMS16-BH015]
MRSSMRSSRIGQAGLRTGGLRRAGLLGAATAALLPLSAPAALAASPSPSSSASSSVSTSASPGSAAAPATTAGTSFLTATKLVAGQDATVAASTGDYLYWAFSASEGQTDTVQVNVSLPPTTDRHGPQTWSVEVFDGLRRRQACTAGPQDVTADPATASVRLNCTLRQVRSWAEPWSGDPLPGTYYVRLSLPDANPQDLGLSAQVEVHIAAKGNVDNAQPEGGEFKAPLVPPAASAAPAAPAPAPAETHWYSDLFSGWNTRWFWTIGGAGLAALAGIGGYTLTRHPRGHRHSARPPQYPSHS